MLTPNTILQNRYRIIRQLGQGGMGTVYEAIDLRFDNQVALKETHFTEEALRKQFEREARLLNRLRHPALARVIDHFTEGDGQYLVMDFIEGEDLWEMQQKRGGAFPVNDVLRWADQLLDALDYLHSQEPPVIHRDIKPQNLKVTGRNQIILLDFGLAKGFAGQISRVTTSGSIFGYTPNYAPLEQIHGTGTDARSDLYSLAATLYHLLTGKVPSDALSRAMALTNEQPDPLRPANELNPEVPVNVAEALQVAMATNLMKRPASALELREMLRKASRKQEPAASRDLKETVLPPTVVMPSPTEVVQGESAQGESSVSPTIASPTIASPDKLASTGEPNPTIAASNTPSALPLSQSASPLPYVDSPSIESQHPRSSLRFIGMIIVGVLLLAGIGGFLLYRSYLGGAVDKQELRYYAVAEPQTFDPHMVVGATDTSIATALFDGLAELNSAGQARPSLAERWETNNDATIWTFHLRQGAKWSDGKPIIAQDIVYSWRRALAPNTRAPNASFLFLLKNGRDFNLGNAADIGIRALDDYTLQVTLSEPAPYFDRLLPLAIFRPVPRQAIEQWGSQQWATPEHIVSSGAFKLVDRKAEESVVERNPLFWDNSNTKLNRIIFRYSKETAFDKLLNLYDSGEIDVLASVNVPEEKRADFRYRSDLLSSYSGVEYLIVNVSVKPLNDVRVRRALSFAVDRLTLASQNRLNREPAYSLVPAIEGYEGVAGEGANKETARQLLAEAGYPQGKGFPTIELLYNENESTKKTAELVRDSLKKELGIDVQLNGQDWRTFLTVRANKKFNGLARGSWIPDYLDPYAFLQLVTTSGESNAGWSDSKYDEMLRRANKELDKGRRAALLREAEAYMLAQYPIIPLFFSSSPMLCKSYVKNFANNPLKHIDWRNIYIKN